MSKVTVGIPVYNGARFVERAVRCFLGQNFEDLEVIVADNASTDATLEICRVIASTDPRVTILTSDRNRGAAPNYNRLVDVARGVYFKWAAHDDWCTPDFISAAVTALDSRPDAVLCYAPMGAEDDSGRIFRWRDQFLPDLESEDARRRVHAMIWKLRNPNPLVFGLMRTDILRRSGRIQNVSQPDRALLNELALHGPALRVSAPRFIQYAPPGHRYHYTDGRIAVRRRSWVWLDARNASRPKLSFYRFFKASFAALMRAPRLSGWDYLVIATDILIGTLVTRVRSKLRGYRFGPTAAAARGGSAGSASAKD